MSLKYKYKYKIYIYIYLARTPEIEQGLGRILSCGARKPEQTQHFYTHFKIWKKGYTNFGHKGVKYEK